MLRKYGIPDAYNQLKKLTRGKEISKEDIQEFINSLDVLSDEDKLQALQLRARLRGFELPEDVGRFLLKRLDREMRTLFMTLDQLDRASITAQRKLTIPFVKEILKL